MKIHPNCHAGYQLLHEGVLAMSQIEANGMQIDVPRLDWAIAKTKDHIKLERVELRERGHKVWKLWSRRFGLKANLNARDQLGSILFDPVDKGGMGYESKEQTESGESESTDESALALLGDPFVNEWLALQRLERTLSTFLLGVKRELDEHGRLHPFFHLHIPQTYRSSSSKPNFQNFPTRNEMLGKLVRKNFIASEGCVLVESDFKGIEVGVAACYHKDPVMISYIEDESKDMHRDMAMQLYQLSKAHWGMMREIKADKAVRHAAKNKFVFPQFYGDWWLSCARSLWEEIDHAQLRGPDGQPLRAHLRELGITRLGDQDPKARTKRGTFEHHVREVEDDFWGNRFKVYNRWKESWMQGYEELGYFDTLTGFRISGDMARNQVINYPVQGSAFHCLLWSLIRIQRILRQRKMRTMIVGQIHDSIIADVPKEELNEYLAIVQHVTTVELRQAYPWIIVPLQVECEISPEGTTWFDKQEVKILKDGTYQSKDGKFTGTPLGLIEYWNQEQLKAANDRRN